MSTVLVTGATGFVGSHMIPALLAADHQVVALVRTPTDGELVLSRLTPARRAAVETRVGDVTRPDTLGTALAGVDAVVHLVAIPRDFHGGADLRLVNTEGTRAVVAAMTAAGVRRLVHMGAMGVEDVPISTTRARRPRRRRWCASGLDWTIFKPSLQFGTGDGFQHHRRPRPPVAGHRPRAG
jgi:NADH dehydrogenase